MGRISGVTFAWSLPKATVARWRSELDACRRKAQHIELPGALVTRQEAHYFLSQQR